MSNLRLTMHLLAVTLATSYITLGIANTESARSLWAIYAAVTFVLSLSSYTLERMRAEHDA